MVRSRYWLLSALSGVLWGAAGVAIGYENFSGVIWGGLIASPLIGLVVGAATRPVLHARPLALLFMALLDLFLGAALFALSIGITEWIARDATDRDPEVVYRVVPAVLCGLVFSGYVLLLWPLAKGVWISFHDHDLLSDDSLWVGLANYRELWSDEVFHQVVWNTLRFVLISTPIFVALSLMLALALNRPGKLATLLRATFFCASVFSVTLITLVWKLALMPERGLIAQFFAALGLPELPLLTSDNLALLTVALVTVWWIIGLPMIMFLSALQQIPGDIYEAAALDNTPRWRVLTHITLPSLKRAVILVTLIEVIRQFQVFPQIMLMTNGGPNNTTRSIVQFTYEQAFMQLSLGYATAASQILLAIMLVGVSAQLWLERDRKGDKR